MTSEGATAGPIRANASSGGLKTPTLPASTDASTYGRPSLVFVHTTSVAHPRPVDWNSAGVSFGDG